MANAVEYHDAIKSHIAGWAPTLIVQENEPAPTDNEVEYMLIIDLGGEGTQGPVAGSDTRGNTLRIPFLLRFDLFVPRNSGIRRREQLIDEIVNYWLYKDLGNGINTLEPTVTRIGKQARRFRTLVDVSGYRDQVF